MKILHIINEKLDIGGAEKMLVKMARSDVFASDEILIVTLLDKGALAPELEEGRIPGHLSGSVKKPDRLMRVLNVSVINLIDIVRLALSV